MSGLLEKPWQAAAASESSELNFISGGGTMITLPEVPLDLVTGQVASILEAFWPILAIVAGVAIGSYVFRRFVRAVGASR